MFGFRIDQARTMFFDRKAVLSATDRATRWVLSRFGAFVRTRSRSSIRKRKRSAAAGKPPSSHVGLLKRFIFFIYDAAKKSVIIGPVRLNQAVGNAPEALEHGGRSQVVSRRRGRRVVRNVTISEHPFMRPAFDAEKPKLPGMWANSVKP